jgi:hypothetical protein
MTTLTIERDSGWADSMRQYRVLLDGNEIGRVADGEKLVRHVAEGRHVLQLKIDWLGSPALELDFQSTDRVVLVRSRLRGWRVLLSLYYTLLYTFFGPQKYLSLEVLE